MLTRSRDGVYQNAVYHSALKPTRANGAATNPMPTPASIQTVPLGHASASTPLEYSRDVMRFIAEFVVKVRFFSVSLGLRQSCAQKAFSSPRYHSR